MTEGHILSWDQFALNEPQIHQGLTKSDVVNWNDDGSFITIENNNFKIAFDRKKGMFESYQVNGKSLIDRGVVTQFSRPWNDNELRQWPKPSKELDYAGKNAKITSVRVSSKTMELKLKFVNMQNQSKLG